MKRCPVCRARLKTAASCYRCGSELSGPLDVESQARVWEQQAVQALANDDVKKARQFAERALRLQRTPFVLTLLDWIITQDTN